MSDTHSTNKVRNFFYGVWCILLTFAFALLWYAMYFDVPKINDQIVITLCLSTVLLSFILGVIVPFFKALFRK